MNSKYLSNQLQYEHAAADPTNQPQAGLLPVGQQILVGLLLTKKHGLVYLTNA
jgi:hypothetical protein